MYSFFFVIKKNVSRLQKMGLKKKIACNIDDVKGWKGKKRIASSRLTFMYNLVEIDSFFFLLERKKNCFYSILGRFGGGRRDDAEVIVEVVHGRSLGARDSIGRESARHALLQREPRSRDKTL